MKIEKTLMSIGDDPQEKGFVMQMDTIEHEGFWWLVAEWLVSNDTGEKVPWRLVRPTAQAFLETESAAHRFRLESAVPRRALDGEQTDGYVYVQLIPDSQVHDGSQ